MTKETLPAIALRVADDMRLIWREGCDYESGIFEEEVVEFAERLLSDVAKQAEPDYWTYVINNTYQLITSTEPPEDAYDEGTLEQLFLHPSPYDVAAMREEIERLRAALLALKQGGIQGFDRDGYRIISEALAAPKGGT